MRIFNEVVMENGVMENTDEIVSQPIWLGHIAVFSVQGEWVRTSGALTGAWKLQVSNSPVKSSFVQKPVPIDDAVWSDLQGAGDNITDAASGNFGINFADAGFLWARVVYTNATGEGLLTLRANGKGF